MVSSVSSAAAIPDGFLSVGFITKPHGLRGDVLVHLTTNRTERVDVGSVLASRHGPLTVASSAPYQDRWLVRFAEVLDRTAAERVAKTELFAEPLVDDDALWVHELIGSTVRLPDGTDVGTVTEVEGNPASDLLVLDTGALVPLVFVVSNADGVVVIDPPPGLLDDADAI